jgi:simple sugar transport system ATP-binding protein
VTSTPELAPPSSERGAAAGSRTRAARTRRAGAPAIDLRGVTKRFPGVLANDRVDFEAREGEVHALLGENGAGKTTLADVLSGLYVPDEGELRLFGRRVRFRSPGDAIEAGVGMAHQHFRLVETFTVAENVLLGDTRGEGRRFLINPRAVERYVRTLGERYRLPVEPRARIWQLSVGERQRVEILKALYREARILILDEPTSVLTPHEADELFATLRQLVEEGRTVIFISHKLREVRSVSDRITILRAGRVVATLETASATEASLASLMVGREIEPVRRERRAFSAGHAALELHGLAVDGDRGTPAVHAVDLTVRPGEIVAVAGVAGNGQRELEEAIAGLRPFTAGSIAVDGRRLRGGDPREAIEAGVAYVPEDRMGTGVAGGLSVAANVALKTYRRTSAGPLLRLRRMREVALALMESYDVRAPGPDTKTARLSGGNLQKLVLAREFSGSPSLIVASSPTRGLDVAALEAVHARLVEAAEHGVAVLLVSGDLDEILALNDRVVVMYEGRLTEVQDGESLQEIGLRMAGGNPERDHERSY